MIVKYENAKQYENAKVFLSETLKKVKEESVSLLPVAVKEYVEVNTSTETIMTLTPKTNTIKVINNNEREDREDEDDDENLREDD